MSVLSLLCDIYFAIEPVSTGIFRAQQLLQDHEVVVDVGRQHGLKRTQDKDAQVVEGTGLGEFGFLRATSIKLVSRFLPRGVLGARQTYG